MQNRIGTGGGVYLYSISGCCLVVIVYRQTCIVFTGNTEIIQETIINGNTGEPLDMGSPYDFFGKVSWVEHSSLTKNQRKNRQKLQAIMKKYNFRNYSKEWWHFTLRWEPYPNTYFDFPIE